MNALETIRRQMEAGKAEPTAPAPDPVAAVYQAGGVLVEVGGGIYVWPSACLSEALAEAVHDLVNRMVPARPCPSCAGTSFWITPQGRLCSQCHPSPSLAVEALRTALSQEIDHTPADPERGIMAPTA